MTTTPVDETPNTADTSTSATTREQSSRHVTRALTLAMATIGSLTFALMLWKLGSSKVWSGVAALSAFGPLLAALELGRLGCELLATRVLLTAADARVPPLRFLRGLFLGQALDVLVPAGRTAAEATKATLFACHLGLPQAAAIGAALQLAALAANALWALSGYIASTDVALPQPIRVGLLGFTATTAGLVFGICVFAALPAARGVCARVRFLQASLDRFASLLRAAPRALACAVLAQLLGRGIQAFQLVILSYALGAPPSMAGGAILQAVYLVGAACGELVPAQLGTTDAAFVLAAPALGLTHGAAFAESLALHAVQLLTGALALTVAAALWWIESRRTRTAVSAVPVVR